MGRKGSEYQVSPESLRDSASRAASERLDAPEAFSEYLSQNRIPVHTHVERQPFEDELDLHLREGVERWGATSEAGAAIAERVAHLFEADDLRGLLLEFAYAWNLNGLGTVSFESDAGCDLHVTRCWSCYGPGPGCGFVSAFLRTLLESRMGFPYDVIETDCTSEGSLACRFAIRVAEPADAY